MPCSSDELPGQSNDLSVHSDRLCLGDWSHNPMSAADDGLPKRPDPMPECGDDLSTRCHQVPGIRHDLPQPGGLHPVSGPTNGVPSYWSDLLPSYPHPVPCKRHQVPGFTNPVPAYARTHPVPDRTNRVPDGHRDCLPGHAYHLPGNHCYNPMPNGGDLVPDGPDEVP